MALSPVRASAARRVQYAQKLDDLIEEMANSVYYWLRASYRADAPATIELAQDASPAKELQSAFDKLSSRWLKRFDELGPKMATWFARGSRAQVDGKMAADLRQAGMTVQFKMTPAMRDAYNAVIDENVGLIRSLASEHLTGVRTALMQSVQNGRDLAHLTEQLEKRHGITRRRAQRIALDQNNKATAVMVRTRALELGCEKAKWLHSAGGKVPRKSHVAFSGKTFDLAKGHDFGDGFGAVLPGEAINCRCVSVPVVPGFDD